MSLSGPFSASCMFFGSGGSEFGIDSDVRKAWRSGVGSVAASLILPALVRLDTGVVSARAIGAGGVLVPTMRCAKFVRSGKVLLLLLLLLGDV